MSFIDAGARVVITYIALYIFCRILGKKLISHLTYFDFITGITVGSLGGTFIFAKNISIHVGLFGLLIFTMLTFFSDVVSMKSLKGNTFLNGEPLLIIKDGNLLIEQLSKARLTINDLLLLLRKEGIYFLNEVDFAFFETDGSLSVQKKMAYQTPNNQTLNLLPVSRGLPITFIIDGKLIGENLQAAGKDETWIRTLLHTNGIESLSDITVAQVDGLGSVFIDKRKKDTC